MAEGRLRETPKEYQVHRSLAGLKALLSGADGEWVSYSPETSYGHWASVIANLTGEFLPETESPTAAVRGLIAKGLAREAFERVQQGLGATTEELSSLTNIPRRTLSRRTDRFKPDESERIVRLASVFQRALGVLEELPAARRWMTAPKKALGGATPLHYCDTEVGAREVENLLLRIAHGVFS